MLRAWRKFGASKNDMEGYIYIGVAYGVGLGAVFAIKS